VDELLDIKGLPLSSTSAALHRTGGPPGRGPSFLLVLVPNVTERLRFLP